MYAAKYATDEMSFSAAAFRWPVETGTILPRGWAFRLLCLSDMDFAVRIDAIQDIAEVTLIVTSEEKGTSAPDEVCQALLDHNAPPGLETFSTAEDFDAAVGSVPRQQMRVNHTGYRHASDVVACDFRLYDHFVSGQKCTPAVYQAHFRRHRASPEVERRVRKYLAWLEVRRPFSDRVREMQQTITSRLLSDGCLVDEYLATVSPEDLESYSQVIRRRFEESAGRVGFREPPVETGCYDDLLSTGCHSVRLMGYPIDMPSLAASLMSDREVELFLSSRLRQRGVAPQRTGQVRPEARVFISYSTPDLVQAKAICQFLEDNGVRCWIAPRDIELSLDPYPQAIQDGIENAEVIIVILSEAANRSVHVPREVDLALERKLAIVPIRLEDVAPIGQLRYLLRTCQWLNAFNRQFDDALVELLARIGSAK